MATEIIPNTFDLLLKRFNSLVATAPEPSKVAVKLNELKQEAMIKGSLTNRQMDSIVGRIDNYLAGGYGVKLGKASLPYKGNHAPAKK